MSCQDIFFLNSFLYTNLVRIYCFRMDEVIWPFKSKQDAPTMQEHPPKNFVPLHHHFRSVPKHRHQLVRISSTRFRQAKKHSWDENI